MGLLQKTKEIKPIYLIIIIIVLISVFRIIKLSEDQFCLGWDCPHYLYKIKYVPIGEVKQEPVFYMVSKFLAYFMDPILVIKLLQVVLPIITSFGIYLLMKDRHKTSTILISIFLLNMLLGYNRIWQDNYRNLMLLAIMPYFLYVFFKGYMTMSIAFLGLMSYTHSTWLYMIPFMFVYSLLKRNKEWIWVSLIITVATTLLWLPYIFGQASFFVQHHVLASYTIPYKPLEIMFYINEFSPIFWVLAIISIGILDRKNDYHLLFLSLFLVILITPFIPFIREGIRSTQMLSFPVALMVSILFERANKQITFGLLSIGLIAVFIFGMNYVSLLRQGIHDPEIEAINWIQENTENDSAVLITSRELYFVKYMTRKQVIEANWWYIRGFHTDLNLSFAELQYFYADFPTNASLIYSANHSETLKAIERLKIEHNNNNIYWLYEKREIFAPYNSTLLEEKENYLNVVKRIQNVSIVKL